jgi:hypothetical protein
MLREPGCHPALGCSDGIQAVNGATPVLSRGLLRLPDPRLHGLACTDLMPVAKMNHEQEAVMKTTELTLPELALIAGTRALLGAGLGLLLADRLNEDQRKAAGWTMFLIGAATTIPLAINVLTKRQ